MRAPSFWQHDGVLPALLSPLSCLYAAATARRVARPGWRAAVPVICCGNATAGGTGKTTVALDIGVRLVARGKPVAFLTRGYGSRIVEPVRVDPDRHGARDVGDEALLLAAVAPTIVCPDRGAGARAAVAEGAKVLVMDDGLQSPSLVRDFSMLVIDGASGFGNRRVIPAGPLREPVAAAAARCQAAVIIGEDCHGATAMLPPGLPVLRAELRSAAAVEALRGGPVLAFAGIGRPGKFFDTLASAGLTLAGRMAFPDHHPYSAMDVQRVLDEARRLGATPVTTPKDAVRLPEPARGMVSVVGVDLVWQDPAALEALLDRVVGART
ncbi:tetraacyldisaccharide 4'-kinase [Limobrevibacterium gyesilva]|uniref:Tetraacyldisaccharide 4'-kinase n=1 Tax=Limobrevibacterium gyesilva TaxID=2991712 RepID=A0AA42CD67_9PROT|nr:tetraacyldisaccharide 4'-kinase [Limobrevibacterium gyesilva]MCW3473344.1 tetraacyldisaccharide 4'-kinase [Limobrevibacterium gyesilva]